MTELNVEETLKKCDEEFLIGLKSLIIKELKRRLEDESRKTKTNT